MSTLSPPASTGKRPERDLHYNYDLQVWIDYGKVVDCCHPSQMQPNCCNGHRFAGLTEAHAIAKRAKIGDVWAP